MQSLLFLLLLAANTSLLVFTSGPIQLALSLLQGLLFVGCLEVIHQCTHANFVEDKTGNKLLGEWLSPFLLLDFGHYKTFHLDHHKFACTENDPEMASYSGSSSLTTFFLLSPLNYILFCKTVHNYRKSSLSPSCYLIAAALVALAFYSPSIFIMAYAIPFTLFCHIDQIFNQAEHHGFGFNEPPENRRECANDIHLPFLFSWLFVHRNFHRVHHWKPQTKWFNTPSLFHSNYPYKSRSSSLFNFLKVLIDNGVRSAK